MAVTALELGFEIFILMKSFLCINIEIYDLKLLFIFHPRGEGV